MKIVVVCECVYVCAAVSVCMPGVCGKIFYFVSFKMFIYFKDGHNCKYSWLYAMLVKTQSNFASVNIMHFHCACLPCDELIFYCKCFYRSFICCHITSDEGLRNTYVIVKGLH